MAPPPMRLLTNSLKYKFIWDQGTIRVICCHSAITEISQLDVAGLEPKTFRPQLRNADHTATASFIAAILSVGPLSPQSSLLLFYYQRRSSVTTFTFLSLLSSHSPPLNGTVAPPGSLCYRCRRLHHSYSCTSAKSLSPPFPQPRAF